MDDSSADFRKQIDVYRAMDDDVALTLIVAT